MRPVVVTASTATAANVSNWVLLDRHPAPISISYQLDIATDATGAVVAVQSTLVTAENLSATSSTINEVSGATADTAGSLSKPVTALRIYVSGAASAAGGTAILRVQQSGN